MSESVVADFVAEALQDGSDRLEPEQCRVLLSERRLVVAGGEQRTVVDLDSVVDAFVSRIPRDLDDFFDQSVLVAYADGGERHTVLIRGEHERIDRFARYLYKATLGGSVVHVTHPARRGGRLLDTSPREATITPTADAVALRGEDWECRIPIEDVLHVSQGSRDGGGPARHALAVNYQHDGEVLTTEIADDTAGRLTVLGRHLRLEYVQRERELAGVTLDDDEVAALVALHAGVTPEAVPGVLDRDTDEVPEVLDRLAASGLLEDATTGELTTRGRIVVARRADRVES